MTKCYCCERQAKGKVKFGEIEYLFCQPDLIQHIRANRQAVRYLKRKKSA